MPVTPKIPADRNGERESIRQRRRRKKTPEIDKVERVMREQFSLNPSGFAESMFRVKHDPWQEQCGWSLGTQQKIAIAGAKGVGKDFFAAWSIWWFMLCHPFPKVAATSASRTTLQTNLWGELSYFYRNTPLLQRVFEMGERRIYAREFPREWFCIARQAAARHSGGDDGQKQAEALQGMYSDHTYVVVDEASGVDDAVCRAVEGSANTPTRKLLFIGNPLRRVGYFADVFLRPAFRHGWVNYNVAYDMSRQTNTPVARAIRAQWVRQYGPDSAYVAASVYGQFPRAGTIDTIFTLDEVTAAWLRGAMDDTSLPVDVGVDVARFGDDETVYVVRRGSLILEMVCEAKTSGPHAVGKAKALAMKWLDRTRDMVIAAPQIEREWDETAISRVTFRVDEGGLGGGAVVDPLREDGFRCAGVENGRKASPKMRKRYANLGAELWMQDGKQAIPRVAMRDMLLNGSPAPEGGDDILSAQLTGRQYTFTTGRDSQMRLKEKAEMKQRGLGSPDRADAFILAVGDLAKMGSLNPMSQIGIY